jgi:hypothetical protein
MITQNVRQLWLSKLAICDLEVTIASLPAP